MSSPVTPVLAERLVSLGRAVVEAHRYASPEIQGLDTALREALALVPGAGRDGLLREAEGLILAGPEAKPAPAGPRLAESAPKGTVQELMQKNASLELKLQAAAARCAELEATLRRERENLKQATESLALQQRQIKELQQTRTQLLDDVNRVEAELRRQINETEQVRLDYEKLKSTRQAIGGQVTGQAEQINTLKAENEQLRERLAAAQHERDHQAAAAETAVEAAEGRTAEAAFGQLWTRMHEQVPEVFVPTHVPNTQTFLRVSDRLVEFVRIFAAFEKHVLDMLKQLRQVGDKDDKLNRLYIMLTRSPGLVDTLSAYLATGRNRGNFVNLLRAIQALTRAFGSGTYSVILQAPAPLKELVNYRNWPGIKLGYGDEARIGKYFKETAKDSIPEAAGTQLRKLAGDMVYEDYNRLVS